jgi:hypothetical protein
VTVTVRLENDLSVNNNSVEFVEVQFTVTVNIGGGGSSSITIQTASLPNGSVGIAYSANIVATTTGTTGPTYTWSVSSGTLPPTLALGGATGLTETLGGNPTTAGTYNFTIMVTDGTNSDTQSYQVDITASGTLTITTGQNLPGATQNTAYSTNIDCINGTSPYTWSLASGMLPTGVTLGTSTSSTVALSGTPTATGTFNFTIQVTDSAGTPATDTQAFTLVVSTSGGGGGTPGFGGGGGGGGGCVAATDQAPWMLVLGLLAMLGLAFRFRARKQ